MKILISGASGLIGSALTKSLEADGHEVLRLSRSAPRDETSVQWQPEAGRFESSEKQKLEGVEAAFHLAGENVFGRWTDEKKAHIRNSRVQSTRLLSKALAQLPERPRVLICASAVGYYGSRGDEVLREDSMAGTGFLAEVCREWESAADIAREAGIRVIHARFGVVLSKEGGALQKMLLPFKLGLGGPIGSGRQYFSWITTDDVIGALRFALDKEKLAGAVNLVAPEPVTNREFTQTLAGVLRRPAIMPLPAFALKLALNPESANETLLASQRAIPEKLLVNGYKFQHPNLANALSTILTTNE